MSPLKLLSAMLLTALLAVGHGAQAGTDDPEAIETGTGWMAATDGDVARVFIRVENHGDVPVTLTAIQSDLGPASLVAPPLDGGTPVALGDYPLSSGARLDMAPDGPFILIEGLTAPMEPGMSFDVTLTLDPVGEISAHVDVEDHDAESHSHVGHDH